MDESLHRTGRAHRFVVEEMIMLVKLKCGAELLIDRDNKWLLDVASWHKDKDGYLVSNILGRARLRGVLHRLILNAKSTDICDHKNGNRLDCRKANLRIVDRTANAQNTKMHKDNKSGYKGVFLCKDTNKWRTRLMSNGKVVELGRFEIKEEAAAAYNKAAKQHHGKYARLNTIG